MNPKSLLALMMCVAVSACGSEQAPPAETLPGSDSTGSLDGQVLTNDASNSDAQGPADDIAMSDAEQPGPDSEASADVAAEPDTECLPSCEGLACGDDGCGGSCGACEAELTCGDDGQCGCPEGTVARCDLTLIYGAQEVSPVLGACADVALLGDGHCLEELSCHEGDGGDCCPAQVDPSWLAHCFATSLSAPEEASLACEFPDGATTRGCDGEACVSLDSWGDNTCDDALDCLALSYDNQDCKTYCQGQPDDDPDAAVCIKQCILEGEDPSGCWSDEGECDEVTNELGTCAPDGSILTCDGAEPCPLGTTCGYHTFQGELKAGCVAICGDGICSGWGEWLGGESSPAFSPCLEDCNPCADPDDPTYIQDDDWGPSCTSDCAKLSAVAGDGTCDEDLNCEDLGYDGGDCEPVTLTLAEQIQALLVDDLGFDELTISLDVTEIEAQSAAFAGSVDFMTALDLAMTSFLTDDDDIESPLGIAMFAAEGSWDPNNAEGQTFAEATYEALIDHLNRPTASISLVPIGQTAEHGESVVDNWVFFLTIDELSDHLYWAIVDRQGVDGTYNYGFN